VNIPPYTGWNIDDIEFTGVAPQMLLVRLPAVATEGDGVLQGQVYVIDAPTNDLVVSLLSRDATEIRIPATVTIPAGQTNAIFDVTVQDDAILDGTQTINVLASAEGYATGRRAISVQDNESATLTVRAPLQAIEGQGVLTNAGVVTISVAPPNDISVPLFSSNVSDVIVPASVTIAAGQTSATFNVTLVDDFWIEDVRTAT